LGFLDGAFNPASNLDAPQRAFIPLLYSGARVSRPDFRFRPSDATSPLRHFFCFTFSQKLFGLTQKAFTPLATH